MTATYDLTTAVGKSRLYSKDTNLTSPRFSDEEIQEFLSMEGGDPRLAAAVSLELTAADKTLMAKVKAIEGIQFEDTATLAAALMTLATNLRKQVRYTTASQSPLSGVARADATYPEI